MRDYEQCISRIVGSECFCGMRSEVDRLRVLLGDLKPITRYGYFVVLKKWVEYAGRKGVEPLRFDLVVVKQFLNCYKPTTRGGYAWKLRKMFQLNGELAEFKVKSVDNELPEWLTLHEVNRIFKATESLKWRALFQLTYDGAMRQHEVLGMKNKHVKFDEYGAEVYVPSTKSQALWLRIISSVGILQTWVEQHPDKNNREAPLFPGRIKGEPLTGNAFNHMLRAIARRAKIKKHVFPHLLRHSRLGWLKKYGAKHGISDSTICAMYGRWTRKNAHRMLDRYGRQDPKDGNEMILRSFGKLETVGVAEPMGKPKECPRCKKENDVLSKYCRVCGMVLDEQTAQTVMKKQKLVEEVMTLLSDPEVLKRLKGE